MQIKTIKLSEIDTKGRMRPADQEAVERLAADINDRGLRSPIEVAAKAKGGYRLVAGFHRYTVYQLLGQDEIECFVRKGNLTELRRDELLENLARKELSALEYAQFTAELKRVYMELTGARNGGDRKSTDFKQEKSECQVGTLISWYDEVANISGKGVRTLKRAASIGERLSPAIADRLRGTAWEYNQQQLDLLCKLELDEQELVADLLLSEENPAKSVNEANAWIRGKPQKPKADPAEKRLRDLKKNWINASPTTREIFLNWLDERGDLNPLPLHEAAK